MQQKDLARLLGVSPAMVSKLAKRGMPTDSLERAQRWRRRHLELARAKDSRPGAARSDEPETDDLSPGEGVGADADSAEYRLARAQRERIRAQREQIELDRLRGSLIDLATVERLEFTCMRVLRDRLQAIPLRATAGLFALVKAGGGMEEAEQVIQAEIDGALLDHVSALDCMAQEQLEEEGNDHDG